MPVRSLKTGPLQGMTGDVHKVRPVPPTRLASAPPPAAAERLAVPRPPHGSVPQLVELLAHGDGRLRAGLAMGMQARLGNLAVQRLVLQAKAQPKPAPKSKASPRAKAKPRVVTPPPPSFSLFGTRFQVVGGLVRPAAKRGTAHGWRFTLQAPPPVAAPAAGAAPSPAPAPPPTFEAERTMPGGAWMPQGGTATSVLERTIIHVSGSTATVDPVMALPQGTTITIPLDAHEHAPKKGVAVGPVQGDALDVPAASLTGLSAGDSLKLTAGGRNEIYVFSNLRPDTGPAVLALFFIGQGIKLQGGLGIEGADVAPFAPTFAALGASGKINAAEVADQDVMDFLAEVEGGFGTVQTADTGVLSFGFAQWTAMSDLPPMLSRVPQANFDRYLGKYGLAVATPALGTPHSVHTFVPRGGKPDRLSARNPAEHCLTLNGVELVSTRLHKAAGDWAVKLATFGTQAQTAKADWLAATTAAKKKAARKTIVALWGKLAGLPGVPATVPTALAAHADQMADHLIAAAGTAQTQAAAVDAGTQSVEGLRTNEWALRFQLAGKDADVQAAEVHQAHDSFVGTLAAVTSGIPNSRLLQSDRAHAVLFSSWINAGPRALAGVKQAVTEFHDDKVADPKTKADWEKFPWPAADPKWTTTFDPVIDDFESVAETKLLAFTFDPVRRKKLLNKHFPP